MRFANMKFNQFKIGIRLALGFGLSIVVMAMVILYGAICLGSVKQRIDVLANERYPQTALANSVKSDLSDTVQGMRDMLLVADEEEARSRAEDIDQGMEYAGNSLAEMSQKPLLSSRDEELRKSVAAAYDDFKAELDAFKKLALAGERDMACDVLYTRVQTAQLALFQALNNVIGFHGDAMAASSQAAMADAVRAVAVMVALAAGACALAVVIGVLVTRSIVRPMGQAVALASRVAQGDLTATVATQDAGSDETGVLMQSLQVMNAGLAEIVTEVRRGTETIGIASREIAQGNMDLAARTEQQAASVERVTAAMDGLSVTVRHNAENAQQASELAVGASAVAQQGGAVVEQVVATMQAIDESARKIVDIIAVIDGIAFQTNILALNAAVEAARAGEQGRGFAVVAAEVRNLAQRSASAAKEIKALIGDSVERVKAGNKLAGAAGRTMADVVASVGRVTALVTDISAASSVQSDGIAQVSQAFVHIDRATAQNAALVEQAAAAAERMRDEAAALAHAVGIFKLQAAPASGSLVMVEAPDMQVGAPPLSLSSTEGCLR